MSTLDKIIAMILVLYYIATIYVSMNTAYFYNKYCFCICAY